MGVSASVLAAPLGYAFSGERSPIASLSAMWAARTALTRLPANEIPLSESIAHLTRLSRELEDELAQLWSACSFIERQSLDQQSAPIPQTHEDMAPGDGGHTCIDFCTPPTMQDTQISDDLD